MWDIVFIFYKQSEKYKTDTKIERNLNEENKMSLL